MVTLEFPLLVNVTFCELLLPVFTFPKLRLAGLATKRCVAAIPVPVRLIPSGELGALLTKEIEPVELVAAVGVKTALKLALLPGAMVNGVVNPVKLKPLPVTLAWETVRLALPLFDREKVWELLVAITTLLKAALVGVTVSCGCTPAPVSGMVRGELDALLTTDTLPVMLPVAVGANVALKEAVCPGAKVRGVVIPLAA
jgi:hypothetical protein